MEMRPRKAVVIEGCLPQQLCIETNEPLDVPRATVFDIKNDCKLEELRCAKVQGCKHFFTLPTAMAKHGTGYYNVRLFDDCDPCETVCIRLKRECFITSVSLTESKHVKDCC